MRLQRFFFLCCCLFANLILLAHVFVPHIHHDGMICFSGHHICSGLGCNHDKKHNHGPLEDCMLDNFTVRPETNENITPELSDIFQLNYHLVLKPFDELTPKGNSISIIISPKPYLILYGSAISAVQGLRGPPSVRIV